jgi:hypothetical protein
LPSQPASQPAFIAFVATNSITQGEQVAQLWPILFARCGLEISFAHRTFSWGSDARGKAHVHVVIIGLARRGWEGVEKRLFSYDDVHGDPVESRHKALSPYLFDAGNLRDRHLVVEERPKSLSNAPRLVSGCQPIDDGNYIFTDEEWRAFVALEPRAAEFIRPYMSGDDYLNGTGRWILHLQGAKPEQLRDLPLVMERMRAVRDFRSKSQRRSTLAIADYPQRWNVEVVPDAPFLAIPEVSSERRDYIPMAWLTPPVIPSNKIRFIPNADLWFFGILTSAMHMAWTEFVGGRLESRYQYSIGINYNAFPWPEADETQKGKIRALAQGVLDARAKFPGATLADLYDPDSMPVELRKAHHKLDEAVDGLYKRGGFAGDRERVEFLFALYEKLVSPLTVAAGRRPRRMKAKGS